MKEELFINQDLRTLQKKTKNSKSSENLVARTGNKFKTPEIKDILTNKPKLSEKLVAEKKSEKLVAEKKSEKVLAETTGQSIFISPELLQILNGVKQNSNESDKNRLF